MRHGTRKAGAGGIKSAKVYVDALIVDHLHSIDINLSKLCEGLSGQLHRTRNQPISGLAPGAQEVETTLHTEPRQTPVSVIPVVTNAAGAQGQSSGIVQASVSQSSGVSQAELQSVKDDIKEMLAGMNSVENKLDMLMGVMKGITDAVSLTA